MVIDNEFDADEWLFIRVHPDHHADYATTREINLAGLNFPHPSVNREKYSQRPEDVLAGKLDYGIYRVRVHEVPTEVAGPEGDLGRYTFQVEHDPDVERNNPAHCEIRSYKDGVRFPRGKKPPPTVRDGFRNALAPKVEVYLEPEAYRLKKAG